jgi:hypothetical protein
MAPVVVFIYAKRLMRKATHSGAETEGAEAASLKLNGIWEGSRRDDTRAGQHRTSEHT